MLQKLSLSISAVTGRMLTTAAAAQTGLLTVKIKDNRYTTKHLSIIYRLARTAPTFSLLQ